ncbi:hypothetical protein MSMAW_1696 [Methanosarcina mazei WWM610]|uniref:Uncharacterized protein n=2 Tax=Methanosarcina mazei TaxID=2209 RepID=A0A0E3PXY8_METMZ|nr:hypothetical protein MSMAW_1696 [Methanosarcina mazei WWM610]AKB71228.1 hypothetical protein MSMAC_1338 [Methanosarcina mazei C16]UWJ23384.1 hypothetical protein MSMAT_2127 [Methanosarcina mazei TMA]
MGERIYGTTVSGATVGTMAFGRFLTLPFLFSVFAVLYLFCSPFLLFSIFSVLRFCCFFPAFFLYFSFPCSLLFPPFYYPEVYILKFIPSLLLWG